ncbi:uncharacterized protein [Apostichopus japonicus]|uniref:uncharacterized protein isoform X2 n=1 Tax=Stichopus japonicus TaxID=307972 RepID=UPI003AB3524F
MTGIDKPHETMNSKHILLLTACLFSAFSFIKGEGRTTDQEWITAIVSSANSLTSENNSAENELLTTTADEYPLSQKSTQNLLVHTNYNESYITARGNGSVFLFIAVIGILCIGFAVGSVTSYLTLSPKLINATSFFLSKFQRDPPKVLTDTSAAAVDEPGDSTYYQADDNNPSAIQDTVGKAELKKSLKLKSLSFNKKDDHVNTSRSHRDKTCGSESASTIDKADRYDADCDSIIYFDVGEVYATME